MDFVNESPFPAELLRSVLSTDGNDPMLAVVVLKLTYDIRPDGSAALADEQVPILVQPEETELGPLPIDTAPTKPACDLFVLGHVRTPAGRPLVKGRVRLAVGREVRELLLFGDRRWELRRKKLVISKPEPIEELVLGYANAYGGPAKAMEYEIPYPYNLAGKGHILEERYAEGVALPNIEDPDAPILNWEDQPVPAGFAPVPLGSMFTVERGVETDRDKMEQRVKPEVFQNAHPKLVFPELAPGTEIVLDGMRPDGPLGFRVPDLRATVKVQLEDRSYTPAGRTDTLCILADENRFWMIHRTPFKYRFVPEQLRVTRLSVDQHGGS